MSITINARLSPVNIDDYLTHTSTCLKQLGITFDCRIESVIFAIEVAPTPAIWTELEKAGYTTAAIQDMLHLSTAGITLLIDSKLEEKFPPAYIFIPMTHIVAIHTVHDYYLNHIRGDSVSEDVLYKS